MINPTKNPNQNPVQPEPVKIFRERVTMPQHLEQMKTWRDAQYEKVRPVNCCCCDER